ncbi:Lissencephaly-1 [Microsporum canis]|uniref:Nuclear distribution protein PAC1 n=1 Tax=Arthroderma otae (strain ATCC MYA-4605 / CBS 113480) TaxID=554155 RepID=LIS1_ARTOC|nr:nuclear distribution protein nudF [Microsporum canis CBS 113480]C5FWH1.1 RecName: Full=Nuclear distribution protein PAC1; AltName: Full=Lissencephaly-1 homolog; Short=LIS-1; AltName: Full=nudF homolog [Microsporum canis CBS 113480]EEQ34255.1 nuclear distribution protein nudF [Microsporum canis CBS 113480]
MSPILTNRQAEELHKSIIAYLTANNLLNTANTLRAELNLSENAFDTATAKKYETLLEKKWTSVVRLQKKIMDLESRMSALQTELDNATPISLAKRNKDPASWIPTAPARHALESHRDTINSVAFHPIFSSIASGSDDCTIKIWDWELGELERTIKGHTRAVVDVDFGGPRGGILLASCSSDLSIKLWDPANEYKNIRTLLGHDHSVSAVRFIPLGASGAPSSGNLLVSASRDKSLKIWDVNTGYCVRTLQGHTAWVRDVYPSPDGRFLLSTGDDSTARLWDISVSNPESKVTMFGHDHFNECCALAPSSSYQYLSPLTGLKKPPAASSTAEFMATGSRDKTIKLWDARGTCLMTLVGHDNWIRALAFHPGGKYLFSVSDDRTLRCWDLSQEGKCIKVMRDAHERFITCLRWAPSIFKDTPTGHGAGDGRNGDSKKTEGPDVQIRCVIATGGVDMKLRIFAN